MVVLFERRVRLVTAGRPLVARRVRDAAMLQTVQIEAIRLGDDTGFNSNAHERPNSYPVTLDSTHATLPHASAPRPVTMRCFGVLVGFSLTNIAKAIGVEIASVAPASILKKNDIIPMI